MAYSSNKHSYRFHEKCGRRVKLMDDNRSACRIATEFNHGLVMSAEPLIPDEMFEVVYTKSRDTWSGNIEIGVMPCKPENIQLPANAMALSNGAYVMTGKAIVKDGSTIVDRYGIDIDKCTEGDHLGILVTSNKELIFYVNGVSQGVVDDNMPDEVYAVVDMYGKCVGITMADAEDILNRFNNDTAASESLRHSEITDTESIIDNDLGMSLTSNFSDLSLDLRPDWNLNVHLATGENSLSTLEPSMGETEPEPDAVTPDRLRFHSKCGQSVKLTPNCRSAERRRPLDEFNNGVIMTHRALYDNEIFEIRIDKLVDKWSGSIEVGVTTHDPSLLEFPTTMTNMRSGTIMMSGSGILTNGKGTRREYYGEFNLDELREGDRVGIMRKSNGDLHYYINGLDQGLAASNVGSPIWGVIDLYGMTIKVTIVDSDDRESQNLITRRNTMMEYLIGSESRDDNGSLLDGNVETMTDSLLSARCDRLVFHTTCGIHADVINNGRTVHRPNATEDFNNGVVLTARPLYVSEMFVVRLDKIINRWAGSIEIGVTTHSPLELEFPYTMTNVRSGTWMMTGNGIMHNGTTISDDYGTNLDRLKVMSRVLNSNVGDRIGVIVKENGALHFFVNGIDQGLAASNVPEKVYGVVGLYGQACMATIYDSMEAISPEANKLINNIDMSNLWFHYIHGKNAVISNGGRTASRARAFAEFNDSIVFSNRPLRNGEIFEVKIDRIVDRWSGSIEIGLTTLEPENIDIPNTATDLENDTWMLSGCVVMENGSTIRATYQCNLDFISVSSKIGVAPCNGNMHIYLDDVDQGVACQLPDKNIFYAVVDLYGQCAQVTLSQSSKSSSYEQENKSLPIETSVLSLGQTSEDQTPCSLQTSILQNQNGNYLTNLDLDNPMKTDRCVIHKFLLYHGSNIVLSDNQTVATRNDINNNDDCLVLSAHPLVNDEIFEIEITSYDHNYGSGFKVGMTTFAVADNDVVNGESKERLLRGDINLFAGYDYWYVMNDEICVNCSNQTNGQSNRQSERRFSKSTFCPSLEWLRLGDKVGLKRCSVDNSLRIYLNGEEMGTIAWNIPSTTVAHAFLNLCGRINAVRVVSTKLLMNPLTTVMSASMSPLTSFKLHDSLELVLDPPSHSCFGANGKDYGADCTDVDDVSSDFDRYEFYDNHGRNIEILPNKTTARRVASYNQGVVVINRPMIKGQLFEVKIEKVNEKWKSSLMLGVVCIPPEKINFGVTAFSGLKKHCWIVTDDWLSINGVKMKSNYGEVLNHLKVGMRVGLLLNEAGRLSLFVDGKNYGAIPALLPLSAIYYAVFDLYGQCEQISIVNNQIESLENDKLSQLMNSPTNEISSTAKCEVEVANNSCLKAHGNQTPGSMDHLNRLEPSCSSTDTSNPPGNSESTQNESTQQYEKADLEMHEKETSCDSDNEDDAIVSDETNHVEVDVEIVQTSDDANCSNLLRNDAPDDVVASLPSAIVNYLSLENAPQINSSRKCGYLKDCVKLKNFLVLPDEYFTVDEPMCFCNNCYDREIFYQQQKYSNTRANVQNKIGFSPSAIGWSRFSLKSKAQLNATSIDQWTTAFYGATLSVVRPILDRGQPFTKEELQWCNLVRQSMEMDGDSKSSHIEFSPSIEHAALSSKFSFNEDGTTRTVNVRVAFQLLVRPGSYSVLHSDDNCACRNSLAVQEDTTLVSPTTTGGNLNQDNAENCATENDMNNHSTWYTKETGAVILSGLFMKIDYF